MTPDSAPRDTSRATPDEREQAWRQAQGPDVAKRYKFRLATGSTDHRCRRFYLGSFEESQECDYIADWKVARSPYSVTGVRYYCGEHCPDVPEGTP